MDDNLTLIDKRFLVWEGQMLRGFTRDTALGWYLSGVGASPMPVLIVDREQCRLVEAEAVLRSGRWRVAARDGVPVLDQEAAVQVTERQGLVWAAVLDEQVEFSGFRVRLWKEETFRVERSELTVWFNPDRFVRQAGKVDDVVAQNAMWIVQDCVGASHPLLAGPSSLSEFVDRKLHFDNYPEYYQEFKDAFMEGADSEY